MLAGYTELRELGSGGFGRVVLARHEATNAVVAVKYLPGDAAALDVLHSEVAAMRQVSDPHVARFYDFATLPGGGAAIVMEAVDGVPLSRLIAQHGAAAGPTAALAILDGSLRGLSAAHAAGVIHRDYKPANVLVQPDGESKLIDFGIAVLAGTTGSPAGSPPYMAPEQWQGTPATPATDVYAATCVFYECLTGRPPYTATNQAALAHQHLSAAIPIENVPEPLRDLLRHGMAKSPAERPAGAADLITYLERTASRAYGPDWREQGKRALAAVAAAVTAAAVTGTAAMHGTAAAPATAGTSTTTVGKAAAGKIAIAGIGTAALIAAVAVVAINTVGQNAPTASDPNGGAQPPAPKAYTLDQLEAALIKPGEFGPGHKDERPKGENPISFCRSQVKPGEGHQRAVHDLKDIEAFNTYKGQHNFFYQSAIVYRDSASAARAFGLLKKLYGEKKVCPGSYHQKSQKLSSNTWSDGWDTTFQKEQTSVSGWSAIRIMAFQKDYDPITMSEEGRKKYEESSRRVFYYLQRANAMMVFEYYRKDFDNPDLPEGDVAGSAARFTKQVLGRIK